MNGLCTNGKQLIIYWEKQFILLYSAEELFQWKKQNKTYIECLRNIASHRVICAVQTYYDDGEKQKAYY